MAKEVIRRCCDCYLLEVAPTLLISSLKISKSNAPTLETIAEEESHEDIGDSRDL